MKHPRELHRNIKQNSTLTIFNGRVQDNLKNVWTMRKFKAAAERRERKSGIKTEAAEGTAANNIWC